MKESVDYLKSIDFSFRKNNGIFFTPKKLREKLISKLNINNKYLNILEPSCGTGEFIETISNKWPYANITAVEKDNEAINIAKSIFNNVDFIQADFLEINLSKKYELIIGNPPYFEYKPPNHIKQNFRDIISGRTNIFMFFIKKSIDLLKPNGYLAFVVPPSMNNGSYFKKLREYIIQKTRIADLEIIEKNEFDASQKTMLLILQKARNDGKYIFRKNGITIFSTNTAFLQKAWQNAVSIESLNCKVFTGPITWNQHKEKLTNSNKYLPLLWADNIQNNKLIFPNTKSKRKQYIIYDKCLYGPAIIVARISGASKSAKIKAAYVPSGFEFQAENHVNVIQGPEEALRLIYNNLIKSDSVEFIRRLTGNTQISSKELKYLLPIHNE